MLVLFTAWTRLRRLAVRFERLVTEVRSERLGAASGRGDRLEPLPSLPRFPGLSPPCRLPGGFGWLLRLAPESGAYVGQIEYLLADPEMKALLAGSPQAGRLLRPLCRMLGIRPGPELLLPRRCAPPRRGERVPPGVGTFGSRSTAVAGSAVVRAVDELLEQGRRLVAHLLGFAPGVVAYTLINPVGAEATFASSDRVTGGGWVLPRKTRELPDFAERAAAVREGASKIWAQDVPVNPLD